MGSGEESSRRIREENIRMDLKKFVYMVQDRNYCRALVNASLNLQVS